MVDLDSGLVLHLPFGEGSGTKTKDRSKYQNNGTLNGPVWLKPYQNDTTDEGESPIVVYDDDETVWTAYSWGGGATVGAPTLSEELTIKQKGTSSLKFVSVAGADTWAGALRTFSPAQDWTKYDFLSLWIYGANTGNIFYISWGTNDSNRWYYLITDNFSGWKRFIVPFNRYYGVVGSPSLSSILQFRIYHNVPAITLYLDRTIVDVGNWRHGEALDFDGANDQVLVTGSSSLKPQYISLCAWVKLSQATGDYQILFDNGGWTWRLFIMGSGYVRFYQTGSPATAVETNISLIDGVWHYIVATFGSGDDLIKIFVDGVLKATASRLDSNTLQTWTGNLIIGVHTDLATYPLKGILDEARIYNRALSSEEIRTLYNEKAFDLNRGLVLHLSMEEGSGTKTYDKSKYQNNGTLLPLGSEPTWVDGKIGKALDFDGINDHLQTIGNVGITGNSSRTLMFWCKLITLADTKSIIGWGNGVNYGSFVASIYNNHWYFWGQAYDWDTGVTPQTGIWQHHVVTFDGTTVRWRINGVELGTGYSRPLLNTIDGLLYIGRFLPSLGFGYSNVDVDEVRIYNRALSSEEIRTLYLKTVR